MLLFDLFVLSRTITLLEFQTLGKMDPKNIPGVPQQLGIDSSKTGDKDFENMQLHIDNTGAQGAVGGD